MVFLLIFFFNFIFSKKQISFLRCGITLTGQCCLSPRSLLVVAALLPTRAFFRCQVFWTSPQGLALDTLRTLALEQAARTVQSFYREFIKGRARLAVSRAPRDKTESVRESEPTPEPVSETEVRGTSHLLERIEVAMPGPTSLETDLAQLREGEASFSLLCFLGAAL